jgi:hypothetical protein
MCFGSQNLKKTSLERTRRRWDDNIKLDLKINIMGEFGLDSSTSGKGPVERSGEHGNESSGCIYCGESIDTLSNC